MPIVIRIPGVTRYGPKRSASTNGLEVHRRDDGAMIVCQSCQARLFVPENGTVQYVDSFEHRNDCACCAKVEEKMASLPRRMKARLDERSAGSV